MSSLKALLSAAQALPSDVLVNAMSEFHMDAMNAKARLDTLRSQLSVAHMSPERVEAERQTILQAIADREASHAAAMKTLRKSLELLSVDPDDARGQIKDARLKAVEAARAFKALETIITMRQLSNMLDGAQIDKLLEVEEPHV